MTPDNQNDVDLLKIVKGVYLLTLVGIGWTAVLAAGIGVAEQPTSFFWLLQVCGFFSVLHALREVAVSLMAEADHE